MRLAIAVVIAAGCTKAEKAPEPTAAPRPAPAVAVDAAVVPIDAAAPPDAVSASARRLHYRSTSAGLIRNFARRFTAVLTIDGDVVELAWTRDTGNARRIDGDEHTKPWTEEDRGALRGTRDGDSLRLRDAAGAEVVLTCKDTSMKVLRAGAVIVVHESNEDECPGDWSWKPKQRSKVKVLRCSGSDELGEMTFGDPGIEDVYENSDCMVQDGGTRLMPPMP